jgi:hypothetical protein
MYSLSINLYSWTGSVYWLYIYDVYISPFTANLLLLEFRAAYKFYICAPACKLVIRSPILHSQTYLCVLFRTYLSHTHAHTSYYLVLNNDPWNSVFTKVYISIRHPSELSVLESASLHLGDIDRDLAEWEEFWFFNLLIQNPTRFALYCSIWRC